MIEKILIISPSQSLFRVGTSDRIQTAKKIESQKAENDQKIDHIAEPDGQKSEYSGKNRAHNKW